MELKIDNHSCDIGSGRVVIPPFDLATLADPERCRSGRTLKLEIPATAANVAALNGGGGLHADPKFNAALHRASVEAEGVVIFEGVVKLLSQGDRGFCIEIMEGGAEWAQQAARCDISQSGIDFSTTLTPTSVCESWSGEQAVRFLPLHRDAYPEVRSSSDLLPAQRLLSVDDYHPFIHVAALVERIFAQAGYEVRSNFLSSPLFRSLYISGAYPRRDIAALESRMGFRAGRVSEVTAEADFMGRVYADPSAVYHTLGNIVETAAQGTVDDNGAAVENLYNNGGCFGMKNGHAVYTPLTAADVGFDYHLRYTTEHRIRSRDTLTGFDTFFLGTGSQISFTLANRYEDRRGGIAPNHTYRVVVFDHEAGASYRLTYTKDGVAGVHWSDFAARSAAATTAVTGELANPVLLTLGADGWIPYGGDWALYDGYVEERGESIVEVRLQSVAEPLAADRPKYFDQILFGGAEEGMKMTLHRDCSLTPRFQSSPGIGSQVGFGEVSNLGVSQMELLAALAQMFNLRFLTDKALRTVRIEPAEELFAVGEVDWSSRTDLSCGVTVAERCTGERERRTWGYMAGDGAVMRFEKASGAKFGHHTYSDSGYGSVMGEEKNSNPLFAPTLNAAQLDTSASSALLPQVGDRDDMASGDEFTPRIVCYAGLHPLPEGERWPSPSAGDGYPLAAFHFAVDDTTEGFTLCFENRDGLEGLHRYRDAEVEREFAGESITLTVRLAPDEYAALFVPESGVAELRSTFRVDTGHGVVRARLAEVGEYDAATHRLRCRFNRLKGD